jgi:hypothetical protein
MAKPFDATLKDLGDESPEAFVSEFDGPPQLPVAPLNVDLSTVTTAADLVFGLGDPLKEIIHIDCQASAKADLPADLHAYNSLLHRRCKVPVHTIVLLLRPEARHRELTGTLKYAARPRRGGTTFKYEVIPLWKRPVEHFLNGPLGIAPLAVLSRLPANIPREQGLAGVIQRLCERLQQEAPPEKFGKLLTSAFVLTGLRVPLQQQAKALFRGVQGMEESSTYLAILDEGRLDHARNVVLRLGQKKFGPAGDDVVTAVKGIDDLDRLDRLIEGYTKASSWHELLQMP